MYKSKMKADKSRIAVLVKALEQQLGINNCDESHQSAEGLLVLATTALGETSPVRARLNEKTQ